MYLSVVHDFLGTDQETAERAATREEFFDVTVQLPAGVLGPHRRGASASVTLPIDGGAPGRYA